MKNSKSLVIFLVAIIVVLSLLCVLFATDVIDFNKGQSNNETNNNKNEVNYDEYIGTWKNNQTQNSITIKNISDDKITFTWFLYRLAGIDADTTIDFSNGKAIFYYEGTYDENYDGIITTDEKYMRKATIDLTGNGVTVIVEDVISIDEGFKVLSELNDFGGADYVKSGIYTHQVKS